MEKGTLLREMEEFKKTETTRQRRLGRKLGRERRLREAVLREQVLPFLPLSMSSQFRLVSYSVNFNIDLTFQATKNLAKDEKAVKLALGLVSKSVQTLEKADWVIDSEPTALVNTGDTVSKLMVELYARKVVDERYQCVHIIFKGFDDTPVCHLVEKDVIIAAQYTPERIERRLTVECDQAETEEVVE